MSDLPPRHGSRPPSVLPLPAPERAGPERVPGEIRVALLDAIDAAGGVGAYVWQPGGRLFWSDGMYQLLGYEPGEVLEPDAFFASVHPDDRRTVRSRTQNAAAGAPEPAVFRVVRRDGATRYLRGTAFVVTFDEDAPHVVGTLVDITEDRELQVWLERSLGELYDARELRGIGSFVYEGHSGRVVLSRELRRMLGFADHVPVDRNDIVRRVHAVDLPSLCAWADAQFLGGDTSPLSCQFVRTDGAVVPVELRGRITAADGRPARMLGAVIDMSVRAEIERGFRQAAAIEAVGALASGLAHDFNNYLAILSAQLELVRVTVQRSDAGASDVSGSLDIAEEALSRCIALTRELLVLAPRDGVASSPVDLRHLIADVVMLMSRALPATIALATDAPLEAVVVFADRAEVERAVINLVLNARDAMPAGGALTLAASVAMLTPDDGRLPANKVPGAYGCVTVADTGMGIAATDLPRVFDPFFSTKGVGKGTGLGLPAVDATARRYGGFVTVKSELGVGTTFSLYLPT